ncbi:MAG: XdhC family protein [Aureibaculum sp.]|nr:XdhC family protein [Aureibaculum sp.]
MKHWQFIQQKLEQDQSVYLLTVIQHKGSSPGRQGFKMVVADDHEIYGSIGGGIMEYNLVELCKEILNSKEPAPFVKHQIHKGKIVDGSGMICSGEQTVIFYPLNRSHLSIIEAILATYSYQESGLLSITPAHFSYTPNKKPATKFSYTHINKKEWSYDEELNHKDIVYIIGGGHVGLATSKLLSQLGFYVVVFDNRLHINTFEENNYADSKQIIDYNNVFDFIPENTSAYVLIMTNKYTDDKLALNKLVRNDYKFIGVLGSKAKLELMFEVLQKEGFTQKELSKVHAPIGLKIHSQTAEEIAVSIAAQIIAIKNKSTS